MHRKPLSHTHFLGVASHFLKSSEALASQLVGHSTHAWVLMLRWWIPVLSSRYGTRLPMHLMGFPGTSRSPLLTPMEVSVLYPSISSSDVFSYIFGSFFPVPFSLTLDDMLLWADGGLVGRLNSVSGISCWGCLWPSSFCVFLLALTAVAISWACGSWAVLGDPILSIRHMLGGNLAGEA